MRLPLICAFSAGQPGALPLRSAAGTRQRRSCATGKVSEPVSEDHGRGGFGGGICADGHGGKLSAQRGSAFHARALLKDRKPVLGFGVEIAGRDGRIGVPFAREKPRNVALVFPLQRQGVVFRMALKEDELAAKLSGEDVDAGFR